MPQGFVLGPVLFMLYTQLVFDLVSKYTVSHRAFADDNQFYKISTLDRNSSELHYGCQVLDDFN